MKDPLSLGQRTKFWTQSLLALIWALPFMALALAFLISVIGIPVGVFLTWVACAPFYFVQKRRSYQIAAWAVRDQPLQYDEEGELEKPWLTGEY